jgi:MFS family permease
MLWSSVIMVAAAMLPFFWRDIAALYVVSAVVGITFNVFFIAYQPLIGQYGRPQDRARNFSLASIGMSVSSFIAPLVTGFAIDGVGYAETFLLASLLPLIPCAFIWTGKLSFPPRHVQAGGHGSAVVVEASPPKPRGSAMDLLRQRGLRRIYSQSLLTQVTWNLFNFLMPLYCLEIGLNASSIGLVMASYALASIASRLLATPLLRAFTPWQLLIVSGVVTGACFVGFALVDSFAPLVVLCFCMGMGFGMANPMAQSLLFDAAPPDRVGEVVGLRVMMGNSMQTAVPLVSGAIGAALGMGPIFWALALLQFYACHAARGQWRRKSTAIS